MTIVDLNPGNKAPADANHISVSERPDGRFGFSGVVAVPGGVTNHNTHSPSYMTREEARARGIEWAAAFKIDELHIEQADA
jgi:hypothetical protein